LMAGNHSKKLQKTKEELQQEIDKVEKLLETSLDKVKNDVSSVDPRKRIRNNPLPAVGIALAAGFLLGKTGFKKRKATTGNSSDKEAGSVVWTEIKHRI